MGRAVDFAARLELARKARGLSASGLSLLAGLSSAYVGHIERGRTKETTLSTAESLARALRVPPEWLAFGVGEGPAFTKRGRKAK